ncbi:hypothetical protein TNIN_444411 [Trichonephila inaurata madagascariensis]|uniref:Uncharacterized protein n=1 Tax=Trichonephila inaurata madagascariensis TaxID=2747483 RepID=A0A8X6X6I7_9ARAC|nr:hypothetical protein TNIN_444411 [Trichonephila inaurata madagascariensis]
MSECLKGEVLWNKSLGNDVPSDDILKDEESYNNFLTMLEVCMSPARHAIDDPTRRDGSELLCSERQRSQSLNLPSYVGIGRELRRMSSEFEQRRVVGRNAVVIQPRRNSISSFLSFRKYS